MTKAPTMTPAFECRSWKVQQRDHVSSTQLNEMTSCTAAARAVKTDIAARMEQERQITSTGAFWLPTTHILQPSTAYGKVQHPVFDTFIRSSKAKHGPMQVTTVDDERTHRDARIRMQIVDSAAGGPC
jgi:hypothetical protein